MDQLRFESFSSECACWSIKDQAGTVLAGFSCPECISRALDYLEDLLYLDKVGSVSAPTETEPW